MNTPSKKARVGIGDRLGEVRIEVPAGDADKVVVRGVPAMIVTTNEKQRMDGDTHG